MDVDDTGHEPSNFLPVQDELDVRDLPFEGHLPDALRGTLFRNGPNPQFSLPDAHWFHGDGMVHAFTLGDGRLSYRNRWVRTTRFLQEREAGAPLGRFPDDQGRANTNVVHHAGELMVLEEAHPPLAICPTTLRTLGVARHACGSVAPFTAHPKIDPRTGELLFLGYSSHGPFSTGVRCGSIDRDGALVWQTEFEAPYSSMIHDFAMTPNFLVIPVLPLAGDLDRVRRGGPAFVWDPALGASIALQPRGGSSQDIAWIEAPAKYAFHITNAWEADGCIHLDVMQYDEPPFFPHAEGVPAVPQPTRATPWRWTIAADRAEPLHVARLGDVAGEFARIDDRRAGLPFRFSYFACFRPDAPDHGLNGLARLDHRTGEHRLFGFAARDGISEPVFVPRTPDAAPDDGWLLAVLWSARRRGSDLLVFEADAIEAGPLARAALPCRVPFGFHGNWVGEAALREGASA